MLMLVYICNAVEKALLMARGWLAAAGMLGSANIRAGAPRHSGQELRKRAASLVQRLVLLDNSSVSAGACGSKNVL